jgi:hypothetical protein
MPFGVGSRVVQLFAPGCAERVTRVISIIRRNSSRVEAGVVPW